MTALLLFACTTNRSLIKYGKEFQKAPTYESLAKVVELLPETADTTLVNNILGAPINMGFDYRYLIDSVGPNGCVIGAVFHISEAGKIDQKWIDEICE